MSRTKGKSTEGLWLHAPTTLRFLTDFLRTALREAGFSKGVLGLSGGVDSALVATLAAEALGKDNVLAALMPYRTSSPESMPDAAAFARRIGIRYETIDISPMVDAYVERTPGMDNIRKGNVMARQRMIVLYDLSAREGALVIGTSNKTEILLGYGTQYGDTACAVNPIGNLYKTQVWQLAEAAGVPHSIVAKKPSADLWQGQTDEGELGFTYRSVDRLLYAIADHRRTDKELLTLGFEKEFIRKVRDLIERNRFKGRTPLVARLTSTPVSRTKKARRGSA
jgi:NAD+ synthase